MSNTDIDHDNAERLAALLNLLAAAADEDEAPLTIDTLDGYLTALVCGPVTVSPVEAMDALFGEGWAEVPANEVGLAILGPLRELDEVAYLRFASVYKAFESAEAFEEEIAILRAERAASSVVPLKKPQPQPSG